MFESLLARVLPSLGWWDVCLLVGVCIQATAIAYLYEPRHKALAYMMPVPLSLAVLALGHPIDATNVGGLLLSMVYVQAVRLLYLKARWPIVISIVCGALLYAISAMLLVQFIPSNNGPAFWIAAVCCLIVGVVFLRLMPHRHEAGHRTPLPVWVKVPMIAATVLIVVLLKQWLHGFMTVFPMVGLVGAYEARHSLWTMSRQVPITWLAVTPLLMTCRLLQDAVGVPLALAVGWLVFAPILVIVVRWMEHESKTVALAAS